MVYALRCRLESPENWQFYFENLDLQPFDTIGDALDAMEDLTEVEVIDYIDLHRARVAIARESRRGFANILYINIGTHPVFSAPGLNKCVLIGDPDAKGSYLYYQGTTQSIFQDNAHMDAGVLRDGHGKFYIHPDYKKYVRKLIFP